MKRLDQLRGPTNTDPKIEVKARSGFDIIEVTGLIRTKEAWDKVIQAIDSIIEEWRITTLKLVFNDSFSLPHATIIELRDRLWGLIDLEIEAKETRLEETIKLITAMDTRHADLQSQFGIWILNIKAKQEKSA